MGPDELRRRPVKLRFLDAGPAPRRRDELGFQPRQIGTEWNPAARDLPRGAWPVCGEADHGLVAGIEAACTVLCDDPLFGLLAYGGEIRDSGAQIEVIPRDGVRQRFHAMFGRRRLHLALDRDGFAKDQSIVISRELNCVSFVLENRAPQGHEATLIVEGLPAGAYLATANTTNQTFRVEAKRWLKIPLSVPAGQSVTVRLEPSTRE